MVYETELKSLPAVDVITLRGTIPAYNREGMLWEKLGRYVGEKGVSCLSGGYSTYRDEEYKESDIDVEIAIPVVSKGEDDGEYIYRTYPAVGLAACVRFTGPHDD